MIKLSLKISNSYVGVLADRFEILKTEFQKSDPNPSGVFVAYLLDSDGYTFSSIFHCSVNLISEILDCEGNPYQVNTVYI